MRVFLFSLFIALVASCEATAQETEGVNKPSPLVEKQGREQTNSSDDKPGFFPLGITIFETAEQAEHAREREAKSDKHEADDLAAQEKAAGAAERSAAAGEGQVNLAWLGTLQGWSQISIAVVGTCLLIGAFLYTRWTYEHTVSISERQLRAYLSVYPAGINPLRLRQRVIGHVRVKNAGLTIAKNVRLMVRMNVSQDRYLADFPVSIESANPSGSIAPSAEIGKGSYETISNGDVVPPKGKRSFLYVWGAVYYDDEFGGNRSTTFCHRYNTQSRDAKARGLAREISIKSEIARYQETGNDAD